MTVSVNAPFALFVDAAGDPLDDGYVYVGSINLNPITNPIAVFWDEALTIPAAQPLRTSSGVIVRSGSPANIFVGSDYSIAVHDADNAQIYTAPTQSGLPVTGGSITLASGESLTAQNGSDVILDDGSELRIGDNTGVGVLVTVAANARIVGSLLPNVAAGGTLGSLTRQWATVHADDVLAQSTIKAPTIDGDTVTGYDDTTAAGSALAALALNQQKNVVACGRVSSTGVVATNHFNITSATNVGGSSVVTLDQAIEDDAVVIAQPTGTASGLEVRASVAAGGASITFTQYQATVLTSLNFAFVVFGRPRGGVPSPV